MLFLVAFEPSRYRAIQVELLPRRLRLIQIQGASLPNSQISNPFRYIQMMEMSFEVYQSIDLPKARRLLIAAIQKYLSAINNYEKIRPYLHQHPFTDKNVEIDFWIRNPDRSKVPLDKIYYVSATDGTFRYYIDDPEKFSRKLVHEETYVEALRSSSK